MATIWLLDEYSRLGLSETPYNSRSTTKSRTSKPQGWGVPSRKRTIVHKPVMETTLSRPRLITDTTEKKKNQGLSPNLFDPRPLKRRCIDVEGFNTMNEKLRKKTPIVPYAKGSIQQKKSKL